MTPLEQIKHQLVYEVYRAVLKREPDPGMAYHLDRLRNLEPGRFAGFLRDVLGSPEFRARSMDLFRPVAATADYGHVISLGTHCYTAFLLKYAGLRRGAFPFDWIFSSPEMVNHCLGDDFTELLREGNLHAVPLEERLHGAHYNKFHNNFYLSSYGVRFVFNHHDMASDDARSYFSRAVNRMRELLRSSEKILFVQCTPLTEDTASNFIDLCEILDGFSCRARVATFAIDPVRSPHAMPAITRLHHRPNADLYRIQPVSAWLPLNFEDPVDDLAIIRHIFAYGLFGEGDYQPWSHL